MPDIAMCNNILCPKSNTCYRFNAIPNPFRQSYGGFTSKDCEYYWEMNEKEIEELKEEKRLNKLKIKNK